MAKRVLIVGASGFVGRYLYSHLRNRHVVLGTRFSGTDSEFQTLDLADKAQTIAVLRDFDPEVIVCLAGCKDVAACERDPALAVRANVTTVQHILDAAESLDIGPRIVLLSTDYVFAGNRGFYSASDRVGPNTVYGISKALGEAVLASSPLDHAIVRTSAVMGRQAGFFAWLRSSLERRAPVELYSNVFFSPTAVGNLCRHLEAKVHSTLRRETCNFCDGYRFSREDFGVAVALEMGVDPGLIVPSNANLAATTLRADLSLLPDGMTEFLDSAKWHEYEAIL